MRVAYLSHFAVFQAPFDPETSKSLNPGVHMTYEGTLIPHEGTPILHDEDALLLGGPILLCRVCW